MTQLYRASVATVRITHHRGPVTQADSRTLTVNGGLVGPCSVSSVRQVQVVHGEVYLAVAGENIQVRAPCSDTEAAAVAAAWRAYLSPHSPERLWAPPIIRTQPRRHDAGTGFAMAMATHRWTEADEGPWHGAVLATVGGRDTLLSPMRYAVLVRSLMLFVLGAIVVVAAGRP